jgi:6-phosphogluconolactonase
MVATGGIGTGRGLGNQGGLILHGDLLLAVNAGSHEISVLAVTKHGLKLLDTASSGGMNPISVTAHEDLVYVLNADGAAGAADNITGFRLSKKGQLTPLAGSSRPLSTANAGPAQISFDREGDVLVVSEKNTDTIGVYALDHHGLTTEHKLFNSVGPTPFGFGFGKHGQLFVSQAAGGGADASSVSSYWLTPCGDLVVLDGNVATTETAACWVVVSKDGRIVFTTNNGSGSISALGVGRCGQLTLLDPDGRSGETGAGSKPIDMATSEDGKFLYSLNAGNGTISPFRLDRQGNLTALPVVNGLPAGVNGLVAY